MKFNKLKVEFLEENSKNVCIAIKNDKNSTFN